ncbi:MAG: N-acetylmuramoyl-L-alanine amidase [Solirubrobacteraceae bacterium]
MRPALALALTAAVVAPSAAAASPRVAEFGLPVHTAAVARTAVLGLRVRTAVLEPGRRFDLVGVRWRGRGSLEGAKVRTRRGGAWGRWVPLASAGDHGPDGASATHGSDPVWTGGADAVQLSWRRAPAGLRLRFVRVTHRVRVAPKARPAQASAPPVIVSRQEWDPGNACPPRAKPSYGQVNMAFVHHTVSENDYDATETPAMVLAICRYHRNANGWNDIGYNFLVDKYGRLFEGRAGGVDKAVVGAQAQGWNSQSTSVSNIGDFSSVPETDAALHAMANLLAWKLGLHGIPVTGRVTLVSAGGSENRYPSGTHVTFERISGHRDGGKTACPGQALYDQLPNLRTLTAARAGGAPVTGTEPPPVAGSVTLQAVAPTAQYPEPARLTGSLSGGGEVWVQVAAGAAYRTVARAAPASDGSWAAEVPLTRGYAFRALQVLPDGSHGAASTPVTVSMRPTLTLTGPRRVVKNSRATISGTIQPGQAALTASLWIQGRGGAFSYVRRVAVRAKAGRYSARLRLGRPAVYRVRVAFAGTRFALPAVAPDLFVRSVTSAKKLSGGAAGPAG